MRYWLLHQQRLAWRMQVAQHKLDFFVQVAV